MPGPGFEQERAELLRRQTTLWEEVLTCHGVPPHRLKACRQLAERVMTAIDEIPDHDIEMLYGFGDYTRGLASIAAIQAIEWVGVPSV